MERNSAEYPKPLHSSLTFVSCFKLDGYGENLLSTLRVSFFIHNVSMIILTLQKKTKQKELLALSRERYRKSVFQSVHQRLVEALRKESSRK